MTLRKLKRLDLLLKEVKDPYAQENFWRLKQLFDSGELSSTTPGPQGPVGPPGPTPTSVPRVTTTFNTDVGTSVLDLVRINGDNTVTKISDNLATTIPNGILGLAYYKPSSLSVEVITLWIIGGYAGLTIGQPVFISTLGALTHTPPATGMVQQVGMAVSATEVFVNLMQPMRRS